MGCQRTGNDSKGEAVDFKTALLDSVRGSNSKLEYRASLIYTIIQVAFNGLLISEIFESLQGEGSSTGLPFIFIRLTGCNLRCIYCDSTHAFKGGEKMELEEVIAVISKFKTKRVLVTGGEPLLQRGCIPLIELLYKNNYSVFIETHGEISIEKIPSYVRIIMDIKTPGSKMQRGNYQQNLSHLKASDEIKFVLTSEEDYTWAKEIVKRGLPTNEVLFSPMFFHSESPQKKASLDPAALAAWIIRDGLQVRFQLQIHKILWGAETVGV